MWRDGNRGQSIQIGAVLLFGALILALAGYQAFAVPQQNEGVEFSHSQTVQDHLSDLRNALVSVPGDATTQSVSIQLGTQYPARLIAVNPGPPTGALRTNATGDRSVNLSVANAEAAGEPGDVWNGTARNFSTGWLTYRPNYNSYGGAPTTYYGSSVLFNEFPTGTVPLSGQTVVDGNRVSLVALNGSLGVTRTGATSVDVRPVSASTRTVAVRGNESTGENVTVSVPTRLSLSTWEELLEPETIDESGHVVGDKLRMEPLPGYPNAQVLVLELERGETYDLQLAKAGVGSDVTDTGEAYATDVEGNDSTVPEEGSQLLVVEVRDAYNNPVSGVEVEGSAEAGSLDDATATTDADGRATFLYEAPRVSVEQTVSVNFSYEVDPDGASFNAGDPENVETIVRVQDTREESDAADYDLGWRSPTATDGGSYLENCDSANCEWNVSADSDNTLDLAAVTVPEIEEATVDFAIDNSAVATLSSSEDATDGDGEAQTSLSAQENGTITVYAVSGSASDVINITLDNVTDSGGTIDFRADDLTDADTNQLEYVASYDVRSFADASSVDIEFANTNDGSADETISSTDLRGSVVYENNYGEGDPYDITITVYDAAGTELASRTISGEVADGQNPSGNDDLSQSGSAFLSSYSIEDTNGGSGNVRYQFDYTVDNTGDYNKVKLFAVNIDGNCCTDTTDETGTSGNNVNIDLSDGDGDQYRVGFMVYDSDGAVVELVDTTDVADGGNEVVLSGTLLVLLALGISGVRRRIGG